VVAFNWSNSKLRSVRDEMDNFSLELLGTLVKEQTPAPARTNSQIGAAR
jgi:hypothetical protein